MVAFFDPAVARKVSASPLIPLTRSCSASIRFSCCSRSGPGGLRCCAAATLLRSASAMRARVVSRSATFAPGVVSAFATSEPSLAEACAISATLSM